MFKSQKNESNQQRIFRKSRKLLRREIERIVLEENNEENILECEIHSVVSDSLWPHALYSPWNSPGKNTEVGSHSLLWGIFPAQGSNPGILHSLLSEPPGKPNIFFNCMQKVEYNLTLELPETWAYILGLGMIFYFLTHEDSDTFFSTSFYLPHSPLLWPIFKPLQSPSRSFPDGSVVKNPPANVGDTGSIFGSGNSLGKRNGNTHQYSCLGNSMDR